MAAVFYLSYLPNINWLENFAKHDSVLIEAEENFVKSTYRNRCEIAGANGKQILTIPIIGGRDHHQLYKQVRISHTEKWQKKHWQAIRSAYGSAPFFEFYAHKFEPVYQKQFEFLFEFNLELLKTALSIFKLNNHLQFTTEYQKEGSYIIDLRNANESSSTTKYYQAFEERNGFVSNLCALDLIFNEGKRSKAIITTL